MTVELGAVQPARPVQFVRFHRSRKLPQDNSVTVGAWRGSACVTDATPVTTRLPICPPPRSRGAEMGQFRDRGATRATSAIPVPTYATSAIPVTTEFSICTLLSRILGPVSGRFHDRRAWCGLACTTNAIPMTTGFFICPLLHVLMLHVCQQDQCRGRWICSHLLSVKGLSYTPQKHTCLLRVHPHRLDKRIYKLVRIKKTKMLAN